MLSPRSASKSTRLRPSVHPEFCPGRVEIELRLVLKIRVVLIHRLLLVNHDVSLLKFLCIKSLGAEISEELIPEHDFPRLVDGRFGFFLVTGHGGSDGIGVGRSVPLDRDV